MDLDTVIRFRLVCGPGAATQTDLAADTGKPAFSIGEASPCKEQG